MLAARANDGFSAVLTYPGNTAAGYWRHVPNGAAPPASLSSTVTSTFVLTNLGSFDPGPPSGSADRNVAMASAAYAADVNEIKARGGATSTVRTQAQADLANFINISDVTDVIGAIRRVLPMEDAEREELITRTRNMISAVVTSSGLVAATQGLLGGKFIGLTAGGADTYLKDNDKIDFTQSAFVLENLIGQVLANFTKSKADEQQNSAAAADTKPNSDTKSKEKTK